MWTDQREEKNQVEITPAPWKRKEWTNKSTRYPGEKPGQVVVKIKMFLPGLGGVYTDLADVNTSDQVGTELSRKEATVKGECLGLLRCDGR
jgi:hypothetical protein